MDVRKSATDAGYIAVGLGVMGFQQAQVRRRQVQDTLRASGDCVAGRVADLQAKVTATGRDLDAKAREAAGAARQATDNARGKAEDTVSQTVTRVQEMTTELTTELTTRVEPVVAQVSSTVAVLPERVVQAIEPVTARVRERFTSAA